MSAPLAVAPALPLHKAGPYVAAAYVTFLVIVLIYVAIMAVRLRRTERELSDLRRQILERQAATGEAPRSREVERVG